MIEWNEPYFKLTDFTERTIQESQCGRYFITCCVYLTGLEGYSDRYIAEHRDYDGKVLWFSRHRKYSAALKAVEKRARAVKRGLPKTRKRRTRSDLTIKRKKS